MQLSNILLLMVFIWCKLDKKQTVENVFKESVFLRKYIGYFWKINILLIEYKVKTFACDHGLEITIITFMLYYYIANYRFIKHKLKVFTKLTSCVSKFLASQWTIYYKTKSRKIWYEICQGHQLLKSFASPSFLRRHIIFVLSLHHKFVCTIP